MVSECPGVDFDDFILTYDIQNSSGDNSSGTVDFSDITGSIFEYNSTDKIFTTSPSFVNSIVNRKKGVSADKVHYWPQYAEDFYRPLPKDSTELVPEDSCFKIAFTGNIGTAQGLDVLPKTADLLRDEKVKFIIVGDGRYQAELERKISELQVGEKFIMIPRVPAEKIPYILSSCDAGFISFRLIEQVCQISFVIDIYIEIIGIVYFKSIITKSVSKLWVSPSFNNSFSKINDITLH